MSIDFLTLLVIIGGSVGLGIIAFYFATTTWQRVMSLGVLTGLLLYSGVGAAYPEVPWTYLLYYFTFAFFFVLAFKFFCIFFLGVSRHAGRVLPKVFDHIDRSSAWNVIIWVYIGLHFLPLLYPDIRIQQLLSPPAPDLISVLVRQWEKQEPGVFLRLLDYVKILFSPFFYISLYRYRNNISRILLIFMTLVYVQYVDIGIIGRSAVLMPLMIIGLTLWIYHPRFRTALVVGLAVLLPISLAASYVYGVIRIGGAVTDFDFWRAVSSVVEIETSFPRNVGMVIIEGGQRVNLLDYFQWIVTLPIPKMLTGEIAGARINYEISEYILGISPGEEGWYVVLPGLVAESVYIYGSYFFWLHGIFIAFLAAFVVRLMERTPQLFFLASFTIALFTYVLNRAGIGALLPVITNEYLLFYLFCFYKVVQTVTCKKSLIYGAKIQRK
jgi:hypothetical protein